MFAKWLSSSRESWSINTGRKEKKTRVVSGIEGLELGGGRGKKKWEEAVGDAGGVRGGKGKRRKEKQDNGRRHPGDFLRGFRNSKYALEPQSCVSHSPGAGITKAAAKQYQIV